MSKTEGTNQCGIYTYLMSNLFLMGRFSLSCKRNNLLNFKIIEDSSLVLWNNALLLLLFKYWHELCVLGISPACHGVQSLDTVLNFIC